MISQQLINIYLTKVLSDKNLYATSGRSMMEQDVEEKELIFPPSLMVGEESRELIQWLARDVITDKPDISWESVVGHQDVKEALEECVLYPLRYPTIFNSLKKSQMFSNCVSSILLFGPPGTGKTMLARAVASRFNTTFFNIRCSSLASKWRGDSEKLIRLLFLLARLNSPATIFMDEADAILSERGTSNEHEASRRCKAELLVQLDGLESQDSANILFLASTNLPWSLDPAILRRFNKKILVNLPEEEERLNIISRCLDTEVTSPPPPEHLSKVAKETKDYSGSDLTMLCREGILTAIRRTEKDESLEISLDILLQAKEKVKPSTASRAKFNDWNNKFGSC